MAGVATGLLLTLIGALGTALGGAVVVLNPALDQRTLGILTAFSGGLMLALCLFDLVPEALAKLSFAAAMTWFFVGAAFFQMVVLLIPEPSLDGHSKDNDGYSGGMLEVGGVGGHRVRGEKAKRRQVMVSGMISMACVSLHNFPEGVAVFLASMKELRVGATLAAAIAIHNVPEGISVALPVYFATRSRWEGFKYALISGLAEPAAVVFVALIFPQGLDDKIVDGMLAAVGGIMTFLTLSELLPMAYEHAGKERAVQALMTGCFVMALSLGLLKHAMPPIPAGNSGA